MPPHRPAPRPNDGRMLRSLNSSLSIWWGGRAGGWVGGWGAGIGRLESRAGRLRHVLTPRPCRFSLAHPPPAARTHTDVSSSGITKGSTPLVACTCDSGSGAWMRPLPAGGGGERVHSQGCCPARRLARIIMAAPHRRSESRHEQPVQALPAAAAACREPSRRAGITRTHDDDRHDANHDGQHPRVAQHRLWQGWQAGAMRVRAWPRGPHGPLPPAAGGCLPAP